MDFSESYHLYNIVQDTAISRVLAAAESASEHRIM